MPDPLELVAALRRVDARHEQKRAETAFSAVLSSSIFPIGLPDIPQFWCSYCGRRIEPKPGRRFCCDRHRMAAWKLAHKEAA